MQWADLHPVRRPRFASNSFSRDFFSNFQLPGMVKIIIKIELENPTASNGVFSRHRSQFVKRDEKQNKI